MIPRLPNIPTLCLITDRKRLTNRDLVDIVHEAVSGGVNMVQIREKDLGVNELVKLLERLSGKIEGKAIIAVNAERYTDHFPMADAIHFPEYIQTITPSPCKILGRSVHSVEAARKALQNGADYLIAGTIYESATHPERKGSGLGFLRDIVSISNKPVLGIGGIDPARSFDVIRCGASGVAVISAILNSTEPATAAAKFMSNMRNAMRSQE